MADAVIVRTEEPGDAPGIRDVNQSAFGTAEEADLVDSLRRRGAVTLSLVAVRNGRTVGHILFTPAEIVSPRTRRKAIALGPMAVHPSCQNTGIGTRLVKRGLDRLRDAGHDVVVVLGHPGYYPRFGFLPAGRFGIRCRADVPDDVFMVLELRPGVSGGEGGVVHYQPEFGEV